MRLSNLALDGVKTDGGDGYRFFEMEMTRRAVQRITLENELRRAISNREFVVHYQPKVDARTGEPIHGYEERPVAQSQVPGEKSSLTQPFPLGPPALARMTISRDTLSQLSPEANATCKAEWDRLKMQNAGPFTPPFPTGTTVYLPGSSGAINWGGATINPDLGYAFTNVTNIPVTTSFGQNTTGTDAIGNNGWRTVGNFTRFADKFGRPCIDGRIGEFVAVNIATGKIVWRVAAQ